MSRKKSNGKSPTDNPSISNKRSGGIDVNADRVGIDGDAVGRDKIKTTGDIIYGDKNVVHTIPDGAKERQDPRNYAPFDLVD